MAQLTQTATGFKKTSPLSGRFLLKMGVLAGIIASYVCLVGMVVVFSEREIIAGLFTSGQIILVAGPFGISYYFARKAETIGSPWKIVGSSALIGFLSALPLTLIVFLAENTNIREMFVNISPDLARILTFGRESVVIQVPFNFAFMREENTLFINITGNIVLIVVMIIASFAGAGLRLIPGKWRKPITVAGIAVLVIGLMSELIIAILRPYIGSAGIRIFFQSGTLRPVSALAIFLITFGLVIFWQARGNNVKARINSFKEPREKPVRYGSFSLLGLLLLLLPWIVGTFLSEVIDNIGLYILMGLGLNIAVGLAGLLDLGYLTNFAVGAYVTAMLTTTGDYSGAELSFWIVIPVAVLAAMLTGFIFALPVLRMRGDYLAIATLGFGEIIRVLVVSNWLAPYIGGAQGILEIPNPSFWGVVFSKPEHFYYIILLACIFALFVSVRLNNSRTGRQWMALREDEDVAAAMGIDTTLTKLLAFTLSAAAGGLAGAIFAARLGTVFPQSFNILISINVLSIIIIGGMGSIPGIVLGAFLLIGVPELLREFAEYRLLLYGALLIVVMLVRPEGLWPSATRRRELQDAMEEGAALGVPHSEMISHGQEFESPRMD